MRDELDRQINERINGIIAGMEVNVSRLWAVVSNSVQKVDEAAKDAGPKDRLEYAKFLLERTYKEIPKNDQQLQGIVVIFDSADGGMIAATAATLQQWIAGTLTDAALWHNCFFDPPETFDSAAASGTK